MVKTPDRRKSHQLCHANILKRYHRPSGTVATVQHVSTVVVEGDDAGGESDGLCEFQDCRWLVDEEVESLLQSKLGHLSPDQASQLSALLSSYKGVFTNVPVRTEWAHHDVDVGDATPVKLPPYRISPHHIGLLRQKIESMLAHALYE